MTDINPDLTPDSPKKRIRITKAVVRDAALVASGAVAAVAVIAVLKKTPVLDVAASIETVAVTP
jgi:hypothetical protein